MFTTFSVVDKVHNSVTSVKVQFKGEAVLTGHVHKAHNSNFRAIVTPQIANHYSLAQVQVNNYRHSAYNKWEFNATVLRCDSVQCNYTECVTKGYYCKLQFMCIPQFSSVILTTRVKYSLSIVQGDKIH